MAGTVVSENFGTLEFDSAALHVFLDERFGRSDSLSLDRISGGQSNPTFFLTHGERRMVLRKKPPGQILPGAHAVEREYRVLKALADTDVPVPKAILLHEDPALIGTPFYLMQRVEGRVFSDCSLATASKEERAPLYFAMADAMAKLHAVRPDVIGLENYGRPGNYFERQIGRWGKQWRESPSPRIASLDTLAEWLSANMPVDDGAVSIAHGDFRLGNMLYHPTEPRVVAILDWELSTLGHPLADLGFCCMPWHTAPDEYGGILGLDLHAAGLPTLEEFAERYYAQAAEPLRLTPFHIAFALFRFAVIWVGIADRARAGNATNGTGVEDALNLAECFSTRATSFVSGKQDEAMRI